MTETAELADFHPENALESAMVLAARDPAHFADFLVALSNADVFIPGQDPVLDEGHLNHETVTLPVVEWEGRPAVPVFSSVSRLREAVAEVPSYMAFHFRDLAALWQGQWMLLNPGAALGLPLSPAQVRGQRPGDEEVEAGADDAPAVGEPAVEDLALLDAIAAVCEARGDVIAAHRAEALAATAGARPRLVVGLILSEPADAGAAVLEVRRGLGGRRDDIDVVAIDADDPGAVGTYMLARDIPFFRR